LIETFASTAACFFAFDHLVKVAELCVELGQRRPLFLRAALCLAVFRL
jgi:hypothetical protein